MPSNESFDLLMDRVRAGDQQAAGVVFNRFTNELIALARKRLNGMIRAKVDPEDVVNSAYKSFLLRDRRQPLDIHSWDSLWGMLMVITVRKCGKQVERFHADRRNVKQEVSLPASPDDSVASWLAIARDPTPSEAAVLAETVETLMRPLDERERQMLTLALQGAHVDEISAQVGRTERTVRRLLARVRKRLERMRHDAAEDS